MGAKQSNIANIPLEASDLGSTDEIPKSTSDGTLDSSGAIIIRDQVSIDISGVNMVPIVDTVGCNCMDGYACSDAKRGTEIKCQCGSQCTCVPPCECKPTKIHWVKLTKTDNMQDHFDNLHTRLELIKSSLNDMNESLNGMDKRIVVLEDVFLPSTKQKCTASN